jgi:chromosome segregation ATPase
MINGRDTLGMIDREIQVAQNRMNVINEQLIELNRRLAGIRNEIAGEIRKLARFRMDELAADRVITHLDETDREVMDLLNQRTRALEETRGELGAAEKRLETLRHRREDVAGQRDGLLKELDQAAADVQARLREEESYREQELRVAAASDRLDRLEKKVIQAEADRVEKGKPYENDPLFLYLWQRKFLTPEYSAGVLIRSLDAWVARLVRYDQARGNYHLLTELPIRLREHAEKQKQTAAEEAQRLREREARALDDPGYQARKQAVEKTRGELEAVDRELEQAEDVYDELLRKYSDLSSGADEFSRKAEELQAEEIRNESIASLYMEAKLTSGSEDDAIVVRIRDLQQEEKQVAGEINRIHGEEAGNQRSFQELEQLRRKFRDSGYDSGHSFFPGGFDLAGLLSRLARGGAGHGDVWEQLRREQRFRKPKTSRHFGGGTSPFDRGSGPRTGGGFGGGGGFSKGGGFGGGGFRTGGRM